MKNDDQAEILRRDLDAILKKWRRVEREPPKPGWVRNLREALGMTVEDLARRLKMTPSGVTFLERSEAKGRIQLDTLQKAAKAMDCALVYALIPRHSLGKVVENRRKALARRDLGQIVPLANMIEAEYDDLVTAYAQKIKRNRLWRETE